MTIKVQRAAAPRIARHGGLYTLSQSFRFSGLNSHDIATTILTKLLVGEESLLGNRPGTEVAAPEGERHLRDFSPTPGFRFDVHLRHADASLFVVQFSQPSLDTPYLSGELIWTLEDESQGSLFSEEINTPRTLDHLHHPLSGRRHSIRRWLFFRVGHPQVMNRLAINIARLAAADPKQCE